MIDEDLAMPISCTAAVIKHFATMWGPTTCRQCEAVGGQM